LPRLVADVLEAWRAAERLLEELPSLDPDRGSVVHEVERLRATYQLLTSAGDQTDGNAASSEAALTRSQAVLDRVEGRLGRSEDGGRAVSAARGDPGQS
jgi:hypothetical protein